MRATRRGLFVLAAALCALAQSARAQSVADFYRGRKIDLVIALAPGGDYDIHARLVARHMSAHVPGNPQIVAQNMPGAGGVKMANWFATVAPRDGTAMGVLANTMPALQAVGGEGVQFDAGAMTWIGAVARSISTIAAWGTSGVRTLEDARRREVVVGASSPGAIAYAFPKMMNEFLGTKFKIIPGYQGVTQMSLAMERREIDAHVNTWAGWKDTHRDWIDEGKIVVLAQSLPRAPDLPGVPAVEEQARDPDDRRVIELVVAGNGIGRPFAIPPGVPADRAQALRDAFDATLRDPAFIAEAARAGVEVDAVRGVEIQRAVADMLSSAPRLAARARPLIAN